MGDFMYVITFDGESYEITFDGTVVLDVNEMRDESEKELINKLF